MYIRPKSAYANVASYCGINGLLLLFFALFAHYFSFIANKLFFIFILFSAIFALLSIFFAFLTLADLWFSASIGGLKAFRAIIYAILVLLPIGFCFVIYLKSPNINEVTTDMKDPVDFLQLCQGDLISNMNNLPPILPASAMSVRFDQNKDKILKDIVSLAKQRGWKIIEQNKVIGANSDIQIQRKMPILGFISNIAVRLKVQGNSVLVDANAMSCDLVNDAGISDKFLSNFMLDLDKIVLLGSIN